MACGSVNAFDAAQPVFRALGTTIVHVARRVRVKQQRRQTNSSSRARSSWSPRRWCSSRPMTSTHNVLSKRSPAVWPEAGSSTASRPACGCESSSPASAWTCITGTRHPHRCHQGQGLGVAGRRGGRRARGVPPCPRRRGLDHTALLRLVGGLAKPFSTSSMAGTRSRTAARSRRRSST
jgi:hypothetical protein